MACLAIFIKWCAWRASKNCIPDVLHKVAFLTCFVKWRAWRASKNCVLGKLYKMECLKLLNCFLGVFDQGTLVNCRFWMQSDVPNGRQEITKPIITIFEFVLNLEFVLIQIFIHVYRIQKQISWLSSINLTFSLPFSSNKIKKILKHEVSFIFHEIVRSNWANLQYCSEI